MIRGIVNTQPLLATSKRTNELEPGSKEAMKERRRREVGRGLFQVLSQYYPLAKGRWRRPQLLSAGKHGRI